MEKETIMEKVKGFYQKLYVLNSNIPISIKVSYQDCLVHLDYNQTVYKSQKKEG